MNLQSIIFPAPLDEQFQPAVLFNRHYVAAAKKSGRAVPLVLGLERENKLVSRYETVVLPEAGATTLRYVERLVKFLLWAWGGGKLYVGGPEKMGGAIQRIYSPRGGRKFDFDMMTAAYAKKFQVVVTTAEKVPAAKESKLAAGGHLKGCRIGFDLGASDYKFSAVMDGRAVFTDEVPWDPKTQSNPEYHYHHIVSGKFVIARAQIKADPAAFQVTARRDFGFFFGGNFVRTGDDDLKFFQVGGRHHVVIELPFAARRIGFADGLADFFRAAEIKFPAAARPQQILHQPFDIANGQRVGLRQHDGFVAGDEFIVALQRDDERHGAPGFFRGGDVVAVEQNGGLEVRIQRRGEVGGSEIHWLSNVNMGEMSIVSLTPGFSRVVSADRKSVV